MDRKQNKELVVEYKYGRKSGDPNTSCGNTIINAVAMKSIPYLKGRLTKSFGLGDDNLVGVFG